MAIVELDFPLQPDLELCLVYLCLGKRKTKEKKKYTPDQIKQLIK